MSASSRVPQPGGLSIRSTPPADATRSARPRNPDPRSARAPPASSSLTSTTSRPGRLRIVTWAPPARPCSAMLASASETTKYAVASIAAGNRPSGTAVIVVATGERSASAWIAPASPVSVSTAGWIPRASSRSSVSASFASLPADSISDPKPRSPLSGCSWQRTFPTMLKQLRITREVMHVSPELPETHQR